MSLPLECIESALIIGRSLLLLSLLLWWLLKSLSSCEVMCNNLLMLWRYHSLLVVNWWLVLWITRLWSRILRGAWGNILTNWWSLILLDLRLLSCLMLLLSCKPFSHLSLLLLILWFVVIIYWIMLLISFQSNLFKEKLLIMWVRPIRE